MHFVAKLCVLHLKGSTYLLLAFAAVSSRCIGLCLPYKMEKNRVIEVGYVHEPFFTPSTGIIVPLTTRRLRGCQLKILFLVQHN